jgi:KUP system potassium uptake protein
MPSEEDIIGGISAIIWALTLLPLLKYVRDSLEQFFLYLTVL